jgi:phage-related protein
VHGEHEAVALDRQQQERPVRHANRGAPRVGYSLFAAQQGEKHADAKILKGFGDAGVLEVIARHDGDTFRAVYTVRLADVVYVLHVFQKKSKRGNATPRKDLDLIRKRLKLAEEEHKQWRAAGRLA